MFNCKQRKHLGAEAHAAQHVEIVEHAFEWKQTGMCLKQNNYTIHY